MSYSRNTTSRLACAVHRLIPRVFPACTLLDQLCLRLLSSTTRQKSRAPASNIRKAPHLCPSRTASWSRRNKAYMKGVSTCVTWDEVAGKDADLGDGVRHDDARADSDTDNIWEGMQEVEDSTKASPRSTADRRVPMAMQWRQHATTTTNN